ncbi:MAG: alpha-glucoside transport system permease protein, partial [Ilumatobacteraceae bacterium]
TTGWWTFLWNPHFTLQNYKSVLGSSNGGDNLSHFFLNSIRITVPATIISVGIALLAAYAFSWMQFKGRDWLFVAVIAMLVVPLQMSLVTLSRLFNGGAHIGTFTIFPDLNLRDSVVPIWIAHTCFGMPFCIFILKNFVSSLPREIIEAARVDGASHLDIFRKLIVPLSVPAIASLCIFQFVYIWNDLLIGRIFGGSRNLPLIAKLVEVSGSRGQSWHLLTAAAFISMVLPLVVFFSLQRYFVRGLLAGSVKG